MKQDIIREAGPLDDVCCTCRNVHYEKYNGAVEVHCIRYDIETKEEHTCDRWMGRRTNVVES